MIARRAPWRGGSNTTASKRLSSACDQRILEQIAPLGCQRFQAACRSTGALERRDGGFVVVERCHARRLGKPQRERADAGEQVGDCFLRRCRTTAPAATAPPRLPPSLARMRRAAGPRSLCPYAASARALARSVRRGGSGGQDFVPRRRAPARPLSAVGRDPEPRTSISSPASVAVTWMSSGFCVTSSRSAIAQAALSAPSRLLAKTGQRSIAITWCARAAEKPTSSTS